MQLSFRDRYPLKRSSQEVVFCTDEAFAEKPNRLKAMPLDYHRELAPVPQHIRRRAAEEEPTVRIRSTNYNFDVDRAREQLLRRTLEAQAVEQNVAREKSLLREAFITRQRQKLHERGIL